MGAWDQDKEEGNMKEGGKGKRQERVGRKEVEMTEGK